eukprot:719622-Pyramimonas_sp.AAC.1
MPLADAEELYTNFLTWSSERSIVTPTKGLYSLFMDSKWIDYKDAVITDIDSTHHHAATETWQGSESCCVIKTNDTSSPSRCFYVDLLEHEMVEIYASQGEMLIQESEFGNLWPQIEQADLKEIENYAMHECFKPKLKSECNNENFIDATWVRRWMWKEKW